VGRGSIIPIIAGGATQTMSAYSPYQLDASPSYHMDYPGSLLTYKWTCYELSPNFGGSCPSLIILSTSAVQVIGAGAVSGGKSYVFTVTVSSGTIDVVPVTGEASVTMSVAPISSPHLDLVC
jgi:hypothetical protein